MPLVPPPSISSRGARRPWIGLFIMGVSLAALGGLIALDIWLNASPQMPNEVPILESMMAVLALGFVFIGASAMLKHSDSRRKM